MTQERESLSVAETMRRKADDIRSRALSMPHPSASYLREAKRLYQRADVLEKGPCSGRWKGCVLTKNHDGDCMDREGWPARWSDPTYLGDGPWGA